MVLVCISNIWIDCNNNALVEGRLDVAARCQFRGYRGGSANVVATAIGSNEPLIILDRLETTFISSNKIVTRSKMASARFLCTKLVWKPDLDTMSYEQVSLYCAKNRSKQAADAVQSYRSLMIAILCFVLDTIVFVEKHRDIKLPQHLEAYLDWMRYQKERLLNKESLVTEQSVQQALDNSEARQLLVNQIENSGIDGYLFMQIGQNVTKMLSGDIDPLGFIFNDGLAERYYEKMLANDHHAYPASQYVDLLSFTNPSMNILEVGAGRGGQTLRLLDAMSSDGVIKWERYDYTDISPVFFS